MDRPAFGVNRPDASECDNLFKYPLLRVEGKGSGKTGDMLSRTVMVADHLLVAPQDGVDAVEFGQRIAAQGFTMGDPVGSTVRNTSSQEVTNLI